MIQPKYNKQNNTILLGFDSIEFIQVYLAMQQTLSDKHL